MSRKNVRVVIPRNADELIQLSESIVAKHNEDPLTSPLAGLDMAAFETLVNNAAAKSSEVRQLRMDSETATEDRDTLLGHRRDQNSNTPGTVLNFVIRSREILLGNFKGEEQHLGDFGFEVNQSTGSSSGGGSNGDPTPSTGSLSGKVVDSVSLNVISNALIEVVGASLNTTTDVNGDFLLAGIPTGDRVVRISAAGYETVEGPYTINEGSNAVPSIMLNPIP